MTYAKKLIAFSLLFLIGSFLCFYPTKSSVFEDWTLFLIVFFVTFLGVFLFFRTSRTSLRSKGLNQKKEGEVIYEALSEGLVLLDNEGKILYLNQKAEKHLKLSKSREASLFDLANRSSVLSKCSRLFKQCQKTGLEQTLSFV